MNKSTLHYEFPEELIAREPQRPSRICAVQKDGPCEVDWMTFLSFFQAGDILVLNDTKVLKRRVFNAEGLEILFLDSSDGIHWSVLFPSRSYPLGSEIPLPGNRTLQLLEKGRPQKVKIDQRLEESYFEIHGELPLPPYIQNAREERHTQKADESWYQTQWFAKPGSFAAPTASLHFTQEHLTFLCKKGVQVCTLTLHVGLGTFLPVQTEDLKQHVMHKEYAEIPISVLNHIEQAKSHNHRVWAMGTTVVRALESYGAGLLTFRKETSSYIGNTDLLILPGFTFKMTDRLLTNFHQPESTLLALVMAFAGIEKVNTAYQWAIQKRFRLFSYGDLSVWEP